MKKLLGILLTVCSLLAIAYVGIDYWSKKELEKATADWPLLDTDLSDLATVFPATAENQTMKNIRKLYGQINYDVTVNGEQRDARSLLNKYLNHIFDRPDNQVGASWSEVNKFLHQNEKIIKSLAETMLQEEPPTFFYDPEMRLDTPVPNYIFHKDFIQIFLTKALVLKLGGNEPEAWIYLEAATKMIEATRTVPTLLNQMIAISNTMQALLALRKFDNIPEWALEWPSVEYGRMFLMSLASEARGMLTVGTSEKILDLIAVYNKQVSEFDGRPIKVGLYTKAIATFLERPYLRFFATNKLLDIRYIVDLFSAVDFCRRDKPKAKAVERPDYPIPNAMLKSDFLKTTYVGDILGDSNDMEPDFLLPFFTFWRKLEKMMIYKTGTNTISKILHLRQSSNSEGWPPSSYNNNDCKALSWTYNVSPGGGFLLEYSQSGIEKSKRVVTDIDYLKFEYIEH